MILNRSYPIQKDLPRFLGRKYLNNKPLREGGTLEQQAKERVHLKSDDATFTFTIATRLSAKVILN